MTDLIHFADFSPIDYNLSHFYLHVEKTINKENSKNKEIYFDLIYLTWLDSVWYLSSLIRHFSSACLSFLCRFRFSFKKIKDKIKQRLRLYF
jgi:hypothetical protein